MPTRCTEAGCYSGIRNSHPLPKGTRAGKPDKPDRMSGPEPAPPSKLPRSSKTPKSECASELLSGGDQMGRVIQSYSKSIHVRALIRAGSGSRTGQRPSHHGFAHIDRVESCVGIALSGLERPTLP